MKIKDKIKVYNIGFMGLEIWTGFVVGVNYTNYIIDLGENTIGHQRFITRKKKDYEIK
tara:strand:+ start:1983 stop:2156 length:174 start_codon:yes stop_codon:yes gene_type:complete